MVTKERDSSALLEAISFKASTVSEREAELRADIARLKTDDGIKDEIRQKFSVAQSGENVAVIVDEKRVATSTDNSAKPWYKKIWDAIMPD